MKKNTLKTLKPYLLLWSTQSLSQLGSSMTHFALTIWLYQKSGSALQTALLSICSYTPYVAVSIFAGALSDRWNKKYTMLICDLLAALCTVAVLSLLMNNALAPWHMYVLNALSGLMNTVQQPASEVASTLLIPREYYQETSALRSFSSALNSMLMPFLASALYAFGGMEAVIAVDLTTFFIAFTVLALFIPLPEETREKKQRNNLLSSAREGLQWLKKHELVLKLILFLAAINLVASCYDAALPAMILSRENGGETILGIVNTCVGLATLLGSVLAMLLPVPRNRIKVICGSLFLSMSTENFLLAFGKTPLVWCVGAVMGWLAVPLMNANLDVVFRTSIPAEMQGRVYSCRNTLQFITIPLGFFLGGILVDEVCEPWMARQSQLSLFARWFGTEKGSGAAMLFALLGMAGVLVCAVFTLLLKKYHFSDHPDQKT